MWFEDAAAAALAQLDAVARRRRMRAVAVPGPRLALADGRPLYEAVAEALGELPGVVHSTDYKYMCSDPGQALIRQAIKDKELDGVVVGACSPHMHEKTFRQAVATGTVKPRRRPWPPS